MPSFLNLLVILRCVKFKDAGGKEFICIMDYTVLNTYGAHSLKISEVTVSTSCLNGNILILNKH